MLDMIDDTQLGKRKCDAIDIKIGENVRKVRLARGMSQEKLGECLDLTFQAVQKYERGTTRISGSMLVRIARALEVDISQLFAEAGVFSHEVTPLGDMLMAISKGGRDIAMCHDAIADPGQRAALRNLARAMANATD